MKKFENPEMTVVKVESEVITSGDITGGNVVDSTLPGGGLG